MRVLLAMVLLCAISSSLFARESRMPLPAWQTKEEKARRMMQLPALPEFFAPPQGTVYVPAEFSKMEGILIQVPVGWTEMYPYYVEMIKGIIKSGAVPYIVADSTFEYQGQTYNDIEDIKKDVLEPNDISLAQVVFLDFDYDANWTRDYGPWHIYVDGTRAIVDMKYYPDRPNDDAVPSKIGKLWDETVFQPGLYTEGGNFMTDGKGTCWTSTGVKTENKQQGWTDEKIDAVYKDYLNCSNGIHYPTPIPNEGTTHIDMFSKILNQDTIIVSYSKKEWGATQAELDQLEAAAAFYAATPKPDGGEWNIVRIPMSYANTTLQGETFRVYFTHTNSLIVNNVVLVPTYKKNTDEEALNIYKDLMPDHEIIGIDSNEIIPWGGSIHCTTMQIPIKNYAKCGNGVIDAGEECEFNYVKGATCATLGLGTGSISCAPGCRYDKSNCSKGASCGNGSVDQGEACDGGTKNCTEITGAGYTSGTVSCLDNCLGWDESACVLPEEKDQDITSDNETPADTDTTVTGDNDTAGGTDTTTADTATGMDTETAADAITGSDSDTTKTSSSAGCGCTLM